MKFICYYISLIRPANYDFSRRTDLFFHASQVANIMVLEPRISNHGVPLLYFSRKRENVLVYLSNAIEKYCKDTGFAYDGKWQKW